MNIQQIHDFASEEKENHPQKRQYDGDEYEGGIKKCKEAAKELEDRELVKRKMHDTECWWKDDGTSVFSEDGTKQRKVDDDERAGDCQLDNNIWQSKVSQSNGVGPDPNEAAVPSGSRKRKIECLERDEVDCNCDTDTMPSGSWVECIHRDLGGIRHGVCLMHGEFPRFDEMFAYLRDLERPASV